MLPIHTILHPTDFSDRSAHALQLSAALARDYHARLIVLHVISRSIVAFGDGMIPPEPEAFREVAQEQLDRLHVPGDVPSERWVLEGDAVGVILHSARETPADLIVMGTHGRTGLSRVLMGSVAEQVVRRAPCPVLTVTSPFPPAAEAGIPTAELLGAAGPM